MTAPPTLPTLSMVEAMGPRPRGYEGVHLHLRPPSWVPDKAEWLKEHSTFTRHVGWQHYDTWTVFNHVTGTGATRRRGIPITFINTEAGEFLVLGRAGAAYSDDLAGRHLSFRWWRGESAYFIWHPPEVLSPPRTEPRPVDLPWSYLDFRARQRTDDPRAGRVRFVLHRRWMDMPERVRFGCPR